MRRRQGRDCRSAGLHLVDVILTMQIWLRTALCSLLVEIVRPSVTTSSASSCCRCHTVSGWPSCRRKMVFQGVTSPTPWGRLLNRIEIGHVDGSRALALLSIVVIVHIIQRGLLSLVRLHRLLLVLSLRLLWTSWHGRPLFVALRRAVAIQLGAACSSRTWGYVRWRFWPMVARSGSRFGPLLLLLRIVVIPLASRSWHVLWHCHGALRWPKSLLRWRRSSI